MAIKWTKEQEEKIREQFPSDRQVEAYKLGCELFCELLEDFRKLEKENYGK